MKTAKWLFYGVLIGVVSSAGYADYYVTYAIHTGWYNNNGIHFDNNSSNAVGCSQSLVNGPLEYNNSYFVFSIGELPCVPIEAKLQLELTWYSSSDPYETLLISGVGHSASDVMSTHHGGNPSPEIFQDLMDGPELGEMTISQDLLDGRSTYKEPGEYVTGILNDYARQQIYEASGEQFVLGLSLMTMSGRTFEYLGFSSGWGDSTPRTYTLELLVPEPGTLISLGVGILFFRKKP